MGRGGGMVNDCMLWGLDTRIARTDNTVQLFDLFGQRSGRFYATSKTKKQVTNMPTHPASQKHINFVLR